MITIHATKKLYAHLPVAATMNPHPSDDSAATPPDSADNPLSGWHANLLTLQRRLCVFSSFPHASMATVNADNALRLADFRDSLDG